MRKVNLGRISLAEATELMHSQFGTNVEVWNLQGSVLQIPPVPPRPP